VDAVPLCPDTKDIAEIVALVKAAAATFGGVNLQDVSAPRCFEIERQLRPELDIPVFHDDQHGTAIVCNPRGVLYEGAQHLDAERANGRALQGTADEVLRGADAIIAAGRSDYPNQINNEFSENELDADHIIQSVFNRHVAESVAQAVADAAAMGGVARRELGARVRGATPQSETMP